MVSDRFWGVQFVLEDADSPLQPNNPHNIMRDLMI